jgi:hypothetical protein
MRMLTDFCMGVIKLINKWGLYVCDFSVASECMVDVYAVGCIIVYSMY